MLDLQQALLAHQDPAYGDFMAALLPTVPRAQILGVRLPALRQLAATVVKEGQGPDFLRALPHGTLEENHLHSFLVDRLCRTYEEALTETQRFLPWIDNWAVCDSFRPKALRQNLPDLYCRILTWLSSPAPYTQRFALVLLLNWYLEEEFRPDTLYRVADIRSDEYYVHMAVSWYYSMALIHQPEATLPLFEARMLPDRIHRKALQKALESHQATPEQKALFRSLR